MDEIILGAGEVYAYEFTGTEIPTDAIIETTANNVANCSGGFSIEYKPEKYDVKNQYGKTVKSFITQEDITAKTGFLSWDLSKIQLLSTAKLTTVAATPTAAGKKTLTFGGGGALKTVLLRFVHIKESGLKIRFTMICQGGNGFAIEFGDKETTLDAEFTAIEKIKGFLATLEEEIPRTT